jgi:hypothetical protein
MLRLPLRPCRPQDLALNQTIAVPACHIGAVDMQKVVVRVPSSAPKAPAKWQVL